MPFAMPAPRLLLGIALLSACSVVFAAKPESSEAAKNAIGASTGAILQGDSARALQALASVPAEQFLGGDADYRACMFGRFQRTTPPYLVSTIADPFVRGLLRAYQDYWWRALAAPAQRDAMGMQLLQRLRAQLGVSAADAGDMDAIEELLHAALEKRGYHSVTGRTPPLWELMLWRKEDTRNYDVALPEGPQSVKVVLLNDFVSRGWSHYGRCERGGAAGWVAPDALYAVAPAYDLDSEEYRASLLAHESQHFADQRKFPDLSSWELEYRAKLSELWAAHKTQRKLLTKFGQAQSDDLESPHTYANKRVIAALRKHFGRDPFEAPIPELQAAARAILIEDTQRRERTR